MSPPVLTPARRGALAVLAAGTARYSNRTEGPWPEPRLACVGAVYWQSADWLVAEGYATRGFPRGLAGRGVLETVTLTDEGRALVDELGAGS